MWHVSFEHVCQCIALSRRLRLRRRGVCIEPLGCTLVQRVWMDCLLLLMMVLVNPDDRMAVDDELTWEMLSIARQCWLLVD